VKRPNESDYTSHVAYARALEEYCDMLEQPAQEPAIYPEEARDMGLEAVAYYTAPPAAPVQELYIAPGLSTLTHSDNCRYWDDGEFCTCGAAEYHELSYWKTKALAAQPAQDLSRLKPFVHGLGQAILQELMTTPPAAQRTWVGLTDEQRRVCVQSPFTEENYQAIEVKLKENNS
jgi:hypothetical protein